jgi:hypothetical protein
MSALPPLGSIRLAALGPHDIQVAPVSTTNHPYFRPHVSVRGMAPTLRGNAHCNYHTLEGRERVNVGMNNVHATKVCLLCNFDVYILDLIYIFLDKQDQHYRAHRKAARQCARTAKTHRMAQRAHARAKNCHKAHARANPMYAVVHNLVAVVRPAHTDHAAAYSTLSDSHRAAAFNRPSHLSLRIASDSSLRARQSRRDAEGSRAHARRSG